MALLKGEEVADPPAACAVLALNAAAGLSTIVIGRPKEGVESLAVRAPAPVPAPADAETALGPTLLLLDGLTTTPAPGGGDVECAIVDPPALKNALELIPFMSIS